MIFGRADPSILINNEILIYQRFAASLITKELFPLGPFLTLMVIPLAAEKGARN